MGSGERWQWGDATRMSNFQLWVFYVDYFLTLKWWWSINTKYYIGNQSVVQPTNPIQILMLISSTETRKICSYGYFQFVLLRLKNRSKWIHHEINISVVVVVVAVIEAQPLRHGITERKKTSTKFNSIEKVIVMQFHAKPYTVYVYLWRRITQSMATKNSTVYHVHPFTVPFFCALTLFNISVRYINYFHVQEICWNGENPFSFRKKKKTRK